MADLAGDPWVLTPRDSWPPWHRKYDEDFARAGFTAHMAGHLLLGMAAPLLLVLAAPVTLALRALPVARARALSRLLRTPPVRAVT